MSRLTDHARPEATEVAGYTPSGWGVVFTPPADWKGREALRPCEDEAHAEKVRDTFPSRYLPVFAARLENGEWKQVGEVRTS